MDSYNSNSETQLGIYRVRDPKRLLMIVLSLIPLGWISYESTIGYIDHIAEFPNDYLLKTIDLFGGYTFEVYATVMSLTAILLLRLRAIWSGVKLDLDDRMIHIPGGHVSANDFIDFFKPSFLLQYFLRFHIDMDQIRQIGEKTKITKKEMNNGQVKTKYRYSLELRGTFGAADVWFIDEGKRDEIYSAIRELNSMGDPFLRV